MTSHFVQQAAPQGYVPTRGQNECLRYPSAEVTCDTLIDKIAGHRTGTGFTNSRILDFRDCEPEPRVRAGKGFPRRNLSQEGKEVCGPIGLHHQGSNGWRNQQSLRQYYMESVHETLEVGDDFVMVVIPPCYDLQTVYWTNECEVPGLEMTVHLECADMDIGTIDGAETGCDMFVVPEAVRKAHMTGCKNEIIKIVIDAFPPENEDLCERPITHGKLAEACFMVSGSGFCISSGK